MAARPFGSVLVAGALCVGLFGCGGQQAQEPSGAESSQTSEVVIYDERPYQEALDAWASGSGDTTPHDDSQKSQEIQQAIESVIAPYKGSVSVVVSGVNGSDLECAVDAEVPRTSASMIKLAILATLFDAADSRTLSLDETVTTTSADMVGGTGSIQSMGAGSTFTLEELAGYMISDSDNTATNLLIDRLGMDAVNTEADKIETDLADTRNYSGVYGGSTYVGGEPLDDASKNTVNALDTAGLLNRKYAEAYNGQEWMSCILNYADALTMTEQLWDELFGADCLQPLLIANTVEQAYGFFSESGSTIASSARIRSPRFICRVLPAIVSVPTRRARPSSPISTS